MTSGLRSFIYSLLCRSIFSSAKLSNYFSFFPYNILHHWLYWTPSMWKPAFWHMRLTKTRNNLHILIRVFVVRCEAILHLWLSKMHPVKILIRLRECAVWSESSLGVHVRRNVSDVVAHIDKMLQTSCDIWPAAFYINFVYNVHLSSILQNYQIILYFSIL